MYHLLHIGCLIALLLPLCTYAEEHPPKSSKKIDHLLQKLLPPREWTVPTPCAIHSASF